MASKELEKTGYRRYKRQTRITSVRGDAEKEQKMSWRKQLPHALPKGRKGTEYPATQFFDQMYFIGTTKYGCYVVDTGDGLLMIDCLTTYPMFLPYIEMSFLDLGLDIRDLKSILITHGHGDHYGFCDIIRERYGSKIYMSEADYHFAKDANDPDFIYPDGPLRFDPDGFLEDGKDFVQGNTGIKVVATPGHTPGCMSFIVPVTDEGRPHYVAIWGGTGVPNKPYLQQQY